MRKSESLDRFGLLFLGLGIGVFFGGWMGLIQPYFPMIMWFVLLIISFVLMCKSDNEKDREKEKDLFR